MHHPEVKALSLVWITRSALPISEPPALLEGVQAKRAVATKGRVFVLRSMCPSPDGAWLQTMGKVIK